MFHLTEQSRASVIAELCGTNDRTCAVIGLSILEPLVEGVLFATLQKASGSKPSNDRYASAFKGLVSIGKPLDGFVSQCTLLYLLGACGELVYDDIKLLAKIRNRFAHNAVLDDEGNGTSTSPTFSSGKIASWCRQLQSPNMDFEEYISLKKLLKRGVLPVRVCELGLAGG
jgi:hypothetical protein